MGNEPKRQEPEIMPPVPRSAAYLRFLPTRMLRKSKVPLKEGYDVSPSFNGV
jgi:hypothetical protein